MRYVLIVTLPFLVITSVFSRGTTDPGTDSAQGGNIRSSTGPSQRIVQAGSAAFIVENALYLFPEAREQVIAMSDGNQGNGFFVADIDPDIGSKTILPGIVNTETIIALNPDVVVMKDFLKSRVGEPIERVGIPTLYLNLETPEAWNRDLERLGELFGNPERAIELQDGFNRRLQSVEDSLMNLDESNKPEVLFIYWSVKDGVSAVNLPPLSFIQTRMVEMAGGLPVWRDADLGERWTRTGLEQIAAWNPDVIFVTAYHVPVSQAMNAIRSDPGWSSLSAVKNGRIYEVPGDYHSWDQPDARWILGLQWMGKTLHPDKFSGLDMMSEAREFYREMFGLDEAAFNRYILPRLSMLN